MIAGFLSEIQQRSCSGRTCQVIIIVYGVVGVFAARDPINESSLTSSVHMQSLVILTFHLAFDSITPRQSRTQAMTQKSGLGLIYCIPRVSRLTISARSVEVLKPKIHPEWDSITQLQRTDLIRVCSRASVWREEYWSMPSHITVFLCISIRMMLNKMSRLISI